ncbi:prenyltransferase/squalene oxidase repeat-containing protein [Microbispora sp. NPDC088329]|uniref:prenyltransferase/squalene oxidase repeat-containing protein n=1 Tax=Microbispora sp. NPDC088329 TaxID=3154869 RepID=UPI0034367074
MSNDEPTHVVTRERDEVAIAAGELISGLIFRPWGTVSPSLYETGRMVTLAPWLTGHTARVRYLLDAQQLDGGWGQVEGYRLVPTLSATEAILSALTGGEPGVDGEALSTAAVRGLRLLFAWLNEDPAPALPDMPAIELIVPSLVDLINVRLDSLGEATGALPGMPRGRLRIPSGCDDRQLEMIRSRIRSGSDVPEKLLHALEVAGDAAAGAPAVRPTSIGTVGGSPAAAAAWLGERGRLDPADPVRRHLEAVVMRHGGPVPVGFPITAFERSWVLSALARARVPFEVPPEMLADLRAMIGPTGAPAGPGLPSDADTTSVALYALALLGSPCDPGVLTAFETGTHYCTWPGEQGFSVSVNAHVLDAFGQYVACRPREMARYRPAIRKLSALLRDHQAADGSWTDRWHASPFYATLCCALALNEFGGEQSADAVRAAVRWVLDGQREDGSWGWWEGTAEETAYALHILLMTEARADARSRDAAARGYRYLLEADLADALPLWHDKDLYLPVAIVRAAVLAAFQLVRRQLVVSDPYAHL